MTLFQDTSGDPRAARSLMADVLSWYGAAGDAATGNTPGFSASKASLAGAFARIGELPEHLANALAFAGTLHAAGAIGNAAYRKGEPLSERAARMERWDVPAQGARICEAIAALPVETADMVRWQAESWDGTGFPDQLRWHGIPKASQYLALADRFLRQADPDEALRAIAFDSGRAFNPEDVRTFTMWFHLSGGQADLVPPPVDSLDERHTDAGSLLDEFADRVDAHNAVGGRWRRVAQIAVATARVLDLPADAARALEVACRIFGAGEIDDARTEAESFDPLARLGVGLRARNAAAASALAQPFAALEPAAKIVALRGEWFDGTGKPSGLSHKRIPSATSILAAAIAYDGLDRGERLDTAAGTQFDPNVVRVLLEVAKSLA
jgi:response regulator RpfG family c-di-GMP phosphodiesterase